MFLFYLAVILFFFFNDTATTEIYTLSLHDALPICRGGGIVDRRLFRRAARGLGTGRHAAQAVRRVSADRCSEAAVLLTRPSRAVGRRLPGVGRPCPR